MPESSRNQARPLAAGAGVTGPPIPARPLEPSRAAGARLPGSTIQRSRETFSETLFSFLRAGQPTSLDPLSAARDRYLANLAALYVADPALARRLDALPFSEVPPLEPTRDGACTIRLVADDGPAVYAHSRIRPRDEAAALVTRQLAIPEKSVEQSAAQDAEEPAEHTVFLICGSGLGYALTELEQRYPEPILLVAEADPVVLKAALCVSDLADLLRAGRLLFLTSADRAELHEKLRPITTPLMLGLRILVHPYTQRVRSEYYSRLRGLLTDYVAYSKMQIVSLLRNARTTCRNIAYNLPHYLSGPGVEVLAQRARGWPAVLIAAGPSLAAALDQLAGLQGRAVLIAVQTVYKLLLARGIRPHFVTSLDYHEISAEFFRGLADDGGTVLVAEPKANYRVLEAFTGRKHVLHADLANELLRTAAPARGKLRAGSTVAHLSFYLAEHLGCDPLILVGQDLCYADGLYYPPGMPIEDIWRPELNRFQTVEMKQWERIARFRNILHTVPDVRGRPVYTDDQLFTYAEQFQADFAVSRATVIQAGESGMRLNGAQAMPLAEALERYCVRQLPLEELTACGAPSGGGTADLESVADQLEQRLGEVRQLRELSEQIHELLNALRSKVDDPPAFNRLIVKIDALRARLADYEPTLQLVAHVSQLAELRRIQADRSLRSRQVETRATALRQLRRDLEFVEAYIDGCRWLENLLPAAAARLRAKGAS